MQWSSSEEHVYVDCPPWLEGDESAFATYMVGENLVPFLRPGALFYGTKRRDPIIGDVVILTYKDDRTAVRVVERIHPGEGYDVGFVGFVGRDIELKRETIKFDDLSEVAVVAGTCRI